MHPCDIAHVDARKREPRAGGYLPRSSIWMISAEEPTSRSSAGPSTKPGFTGRVVQARPQRSLSMKSRAARSARVFDLA